MLEYKRPAYSKSEKKFIHKFIDVIPEIRRDQYGNRWLQLGDSPTTLYTAHIDTAHRSSGRQQVSISKRQQTLSVASGRDVLGLASSSSMQSHEFFHWLSYCRFIFISHRPPRSKIICCGYFSLFSLLLNCLFAN
jgi:hypothetical protein